MIYIVYTNKIGRFGRQDARDDLFSSYNRSASPSKSKSKSHPKSPYAAAGYGYTSPSANGGPSFGAYPGASSAPSNGSLYPGNGGSAYGSSGSLGGGSGRGDEFRSATPNSRGQYSSAVLDELESQNDEQVGVLTSKVKMLKDVRFGRSCLPPRGLSWRPPMMSIMLIRLLNS